MKHLVLIALLLLTSCSPRPTPGGATIVSPVDGSASLYTAEHDGHSFVVVYSGTGLGVIHHPSCKCRAEQLHIKP